jgi:surface polysaccharide O-acyltransferase-like enzyme
MVPISPRLSRKITLFSFVAIILVVFIHARTTDSMVPKTGTLYATSFVIQYFIGDGIARVSVPLFFAFSGFLFFASLSPAIGGFKRKLLSRVNTIAVPYLMWNGMGLLLLLCVQTLHGNAPLSGEKLIVSYTPVDFLSRLYPHPVQFQFWFLLDLAVYFLVSPLLYLLIKRLGVLVPLALAALYFSPVYRVPLHVSDAALHPEGMLFFSIGAWIAIRNIRLPEIFSIGNTVAVSAAWVGLCLGKTFFLLSYGETYQYNLIHRAAVIIGVVSVWRLYDLLPGTFIVSRLWDRLLPCTFFIYAFHEPAQTIIRNELLRIIGSENVTKSLCFGVCPLLTIGLAVCLAWFLQKNTPGFYSLITGGRGKRHQ